MHLESCSLESNSAINRLFVQIRERCGINLRNYRRATIERRIRGRMLFTRTGSLADYGAYVAAHPGEADLLVRHTMIKVSRFFRNPEMYAVLREEVIPALGARKTPGRPLRVWSAGCGHGEEPTSLACLLAGAVEAGAIADFTILATDIDREALARARAGRWPAAVLNDVPEADRRWFVPQADGQVIVRPELRARMHHAWHDLTAESGHGDAEPFDLVCCRNVIIYFDRTLNGSVQRRLAERLAPGGVLWLGEAEWLYPEVRRDFDTIHRKGRLFRHVCGAGDVEDWGEGDAF